MARYRSAITPRGDSDRMLATSPVNANTIAVTAAATDRIPKVTASGVRRRGEVAGSRRCTGPTYAQRRASASRQCSEATPGRRGVPRETSSRTPVVATAMPATPFHPIRSPRKRKESTATASGDTQMIHALLVAVVVTSTGRLHQEVQREDRTADQRADAVRAREPEGHPLREQDDAEEGQRRSRGAARRCRSGRAPSAGLSWRRRSTPRG